MFKKSYNWIDDYIKENAAKGNTLTMEAFKLLKKELEIKENTIQKLRYELKKYKPPIKKSRI